jgi:hypothetical protein
MHLLLLLSALVFAQDTPLIPPLPCVCGFNHKCGDESPPPPPLLLPFNYDKTVRNIAVAKEHAVGEPIWRLEAMTNMHDVCWLVRSTPYDPSPPPFELENRRARSLVINSSQLLPGVYLFVLYATDGRVIVPAIHNITIVASCPSSATPYLELALFEYYIRLLHAGDVIDSFLNVAICARFCPSVSLGAVCADVVEWRSSLYLPVMVARVLDGLAEPECFRGIRRYGSPEDYTRLAHYLIELPVRGSI